MIAAATTGATTTRTAAITTKNRHNYISCWNAVIELQSNLFQNLDALKREIMVSRDVTQSDILPGIRWAGTKREKIEVNDIMKEGKKVWLM